MSKDSRAEASAAALVLAFGDGLRLSLSSLGVAARHTAVRWFYCKYAVFFLPAIAVVYGAAGLAVVGPLFVGTWVVDTLFQRDLWLSCVQPWLLHVSLVPLMALSLVVLLVLKFVFYGPVDQLFLSMIQDQSVAKDLARIPFSSVRYRLRSSLVRLLSVVAVSALSSVIVFIPPFSLLPDFAIQAVPLAVATFHSVSNCWRELFDPWIDRVAPHSPVLSAAGGCYCSMLARDNVAVCYLRLFAFALPLLTLLSVPIAGPVLWPLCLAASGAALCQLGACFDLPLLQHIAHASLSSSSSSSAALPLYPNPTATRSAPRSAATSATAIQVATAAVLSVQDETSSGSRDTGLIGPGAPSREEEEVTRTGDGTRLGQQQHVYKMEKEGEEGHEGCEEEDEEHISLPQM